MCGGEQLRVGESSTAEEPLQGLQVVSPAVQRMQDPALFIMTRAGLRT